MKDADDASFDLWSPLSAAFATNDFFDALHDHRDGMWPYHDPDDYGFAQCLAFASRPRVYLRGWAFDTRVQDEHGEQAIRAIEDFSA